MFSTQRKRRLTAMTLTSPFNHTSFLTDPDRDTIATAVSLGSMIPKSCGQTHLNLSQ